MDPRPPQFKARFLILFILAFLCLSTDFGQAANVIPTDGTSSVFTVDNTGTAFEFTAEKDIDYHISVAKGASSATTYFRYYAKYDGVPNTNIYDHLFTSTGSTLRQSVSSCKAYTKFYLLIKSDSSSGVAAQVVITIDKYPRPCIRAITVGEADSTQYYIDSSFYSGMNHYVVNVTDELANNYNLMANIQTTSDTGSINFYGKVSKDVVNDASNTAYKSTYTSSSAYLIVPPCQLAKGLWYFSVYGNSEYQMKYKISFSWEAKKCIREVPVQGGLDTYSFKYQSFSYEVWSTSRTMDQEWSYFALPLPASNSSYMVTARYTIAAGYSGNSYLYARINALPTPDLYSTYRFGTINTITFSPIEVTMNSTLYFAVKTLSYTSYFVSFELTKRDTIVAIPSQSSYVTSFSMNCNSWNYYTFTIGQSFNTSVTTELKQLSGSEQPPRYIVTRKDVLPTIDTYLDRTYGTSSSVLYLDEQSCGLTAGVYYMGVYSACTGENTWMKYQLTVTQVQAKCDYELNLGKTVNNYQVTHQHQIMYASEFFYHLNVDIDFEYNLELQLTQLSGSSGVNGYLRIRKDQRPTTDYYMVSAYSSTTAFITIPACELASGNYYVSVTHGSSTYGTQYLYALTARLVRHPCSTTIPKSESFYVLASKWVYYALPVNNSSSIGYRIAISSSTPTLYLGNYGSVPTSASFKSKYISTAVISSCDLDSPFLNDNINNYTLGILSTSTISYTLNSDVSTRECVKALDVGVKQKETIKAGEFFIYSFNATDSVISNGAKVFLIGGIFNLYVKYGGIPTTSLYDFKYSSSSSFSLGSELLGKRGIWYVAVQYSSYSSFFDSSNIEITVNLDKCLTLNSCSGKGYCSAGACYCIPGFSGSDCSYTKSCTSNCNGNGICFDGACHCNPEYTGSTCATKLACVGGCGSGGICKFGQCFCSPGYNGLQCMGGNGCSDVNPQTSTNTTNTPKTSDRLNGVNQMQDKFLLIVVIIVTLIQTMM